MAKKTTKPSVADLAAWARVRAHPDEVLPVSFSTAAVKAWRLKPRRLPPGEQRIADEIARRAEDAKTQEELAGKKRRKAAIAQNRIAYAHRDAPTRRRTLEQARKKRWPRNASTDAMKATITEKALELFRDTDQSERNVARICGRLVGWPKLDRNTVRDILGVGRRGGDIRSLLRGAEKTIRNR